MRRIWLALIFVALLVPVAAYAGKGGGGGPPATGISGALSSVTCSTDTAQGWAQDSNSPTTPVTVYFWIDATPSSYTSTTGNVGTALANEYNANVCKGSNCNVSYTFAIPSSYLDGRKHTLNAYGKDNESANGTAIGSQTFKCYPPPSCRVWFDQNPVPWGQTTTIHWTSTNATSMYINGIGYVTPNQQGSATVTGTGTASQCGGSLSQSYQHSIYLTSGSSWTVPSDWDSSSNSIEVIGGGGGGQHTNGAGGGGAYSKVTNVSFSPGTSVAYKIGAGGGQGVAGGDTYFCKSTSNCASITGSAVIVGAKGGSPGGGSVGGAGGAAASGIGTIKYSGGSGTGTGDTAGGGGGAAGPRGNGGNGGATVGKNYGGVGGGGGGGGSAGAPGSGNNGAAGGNNYLGVGSGAGGTSTHVNGYNGSAGGGGGGAFGNGGGTFGKGAAGGAGTEWDATHGSGGGGGGGGWSGNQGGTGLGGAGGLYGGGAGGSTGWYSGAASGAQGIIVISYGPSANVCYIPLDYSCTAQGVDTSRTDTEILKVAAPPPPSASIAVGSNTLPQGATTTVTATFAGTALDPLTRDNIDFPQGTHLASSSAPDANKTVTLSTAGVSLGTQRVFASGITTFYNTWTPFASTTITVVSAPACTISFDQNPIPQGQSTTIRWSSTGADTFSINTIGTVAPNQAGYALVSPMQATDYTGTATKGGFPFQCKAATGNPLGTLDVSCNAAYTCKDQQTILYTASDCSTKTTACAAPTFCSSGSSTCLYPSPQFNQSGNGLSGHLQLSPQVLHSGKTTMVHWNVSYVSDCTVRADVNSDSWTGASGSETSSPITQQTVYTLSCQGLDGSTVGESATVSVLPTFQEK